MQTTHSGTDKLNMLAAGLITALAVHGLFCVFSLSGAIGASHATFLLGALKVLRIVWTLAGIGASGYLVFQACGMINGLSYQRARRAGLGAFALPLLGAPGAVTAFALIPLAALVTYLLKQADWQILFQNDFAPEVVEDVAPEASNAVEPQAEEYSEVG